MYTAELLNELIKCRKHVTEGWREVKDARHGVKKVMALKSSVLDYEFTAFVTQNAFFKEDFSIGLVYVSNTIEGKVLLIRCNGLHGGTKSIPHHSYTHNHRTTAEGLNAGNKQPTEIEATEGYTTLESALNYFGNMVNVNVADIKKHFPAPVLNQIDMDFENG